MRFCAIVLLETDFASVCVYLIMNAGKPADKWLVLSVNCLSPAYRATLLYFYSTCIQFALTLPKNVCTSCYITCRRFECFYGETMGKYGQFYGQLFDYEQLQDNWITLKLCMKIGF